MLFLLLVEAVEFFEEDMNIFATHFTFSTSNLVSCLNHNLYRYLGHEIRISTNKCFILLLNAAITIDVSSFIYFYRFFSFHNPFNAVFRMGAI